MAALIPALIKLLLSRRGGGGGGGYSAKGGGGYGKGGGKERQSPEEYSMELLDKNARKAGIQQNDPSRGASRSDVGDDIDKLLEGQNDLLRELLSDKEK